LLTAVNQTPGDIRHSEAPKAIDVHFVKNDIDPTGMGEPAYPPMFGALANALYKATGKRLYDNHSSLSCSGN
jgi:CO/xanthine dehydrogenase Mo-binding subunit